MWRTATIATAVMMAAVACSSSDDSTASSDASSSDASSNGGSEADDSTSATVDLDRIETGSTVPPVPAPATGDEGWDEVQVAALDDAAISTLAGVSPAAQLQTLVESDDPRLAWALADLLRFTQGSETGDEVEQAISALTGMEPDPSRPWTSVVDQLIAWDLPAPAEYATFKRTFYGAVEPRWADLMTEGARIDWRHLGWGGVGIDARPAGSTGPCQCIPALDDPPVTPAADGDWYPDDRLVFGVVVDDEARAYPKNIMEVHEMVNDTLGGRRIAMPYCTLCGSAQAYLVDELGNEFDLPVMRTSGLLLRSNKMMYDLSSGSFVDTFVGEATSGPLADADVRFPQVSVVTTTWGRWRADHPQTTIVAEDGGLDRSYPLDPLRGRDDDGPIFPIGSTDPRLPVHEQVLGVLTPDGDALAFHVASALELLEGGHTVTAEGISLRLDGDGVRAVTADGADAGGHQSFWFAWSQFHPDTSLWPHDHQS